MLKWLKQLFGRVVEEAKPVVEDVVEEIGTAYLGAYLEDALSQLREYIVQRERHPARQAALLAALGIIERALRGRIAVDE